MPNHARKPGKVYLVGAGPGDPGLITLRGAECLRQADLVLYDYLVNPALLGNVPGDVELVCLGRDGRQRMLSQDEINARMIGAAGAGKTVVRLKGGDPDVFGRSAEDSKALEDAGIAFETVPGVTAALATAAYVGIPITHTDHSSAVALVTGHQSEGKQGDRLDYGSLAAFPGTLIFYMGMSSACTWSEALIGQGKPPDTPVVIVRRCTWSDQTTERCTLETVAQVIAERNLRPPAVIVVGPVAAMAPKLNWFTGRPLFGTRVMVTRPRAQAGALAELLTAQGADVLLEPAIQISEPSDWRPVDAAIASLDCYDWVVFSSVNGVRYLLDRLAEVGGDLRRLGGVRLAAIGPGTADALARCRLRADLVPEPYRAESLAAALAGDAAGRRFLLARASRGRRVLAEQLSAAGGEVDQIVVYDNRDVEAPEPDVVEQLAVGRIDWVTVTSSTIARSVVRMFGDALARTKLVSISPVTSGVLRELGYEPAAEAAQYTMEGVVSAMMER